MSKFSNIFGHSDMKTIAILFFCLTVSLATFAKSTVSESAHNLSITGPGQVKSQTEDQVCVFCHTPHRPGVGPGLWNRRTPKVEASYQSSTLEAEPATSSRTSQLCLSCHDGTIALGEMLNAPRGNKNVDLRDIYIGGRNSFGVSLKSHHPVDIIYDQTLQAKNPTLANPNTVDLPMTNGKLECSTCHDPHSSGIPPFLNKPSRNGELCTTCHNLQGINWDWQLSSHASSEATPRAGANPWSDRKAEWRGETVAENACENCHATHNAPISARLIKNIEEQTCFQCHDGSVAEFNIKAELQKFSRHPVERSGRGKHEPISKERALNTPLHAECEDCHNPHASRPDSPMVTFKPGNPGNQDHSEAPFANGVIAGVSGLNISGQQKSIADFEYEVCFKCHGVPGKNSCDNGRCATATAYRMIRQDNVYNIRDKVDSGNPSLVSYHPIEQNNASNNSEVPSLRRDIPLNRIDSQIYCGDCHGSDSSPSSGGNGPSGPHGSRFPAMLALSYELRADARFNSANSALCFKCHDAGNLFNDVSFKHRLHVLEQGNTCVNCHDPHGSAIYPHLLNFLISSNSSGRNTEITGTGIYSEPTWEDNGQYSGTCYLSCHGTEHDGAEY